MMIELLYPGTKMARMISFFTAHKRAIVLSLIFAYTVFLLTVNGVGDEAYFDKSHGLHVRKGKVRFYIAMDDFTPAIENQLEDLASRVARRV